MVLGLDNCDSQTLEHRFRSCDAQASLPQSTWEHTFNPGMKLCLLHWQVVSLPLSHQGSLARTFQRNCHEESPKIRNDIGLFEELKENQCDEYGE